MRIWYATYRNAGKEKPSREIVKIVERNDFIMLFIRIPSSVICMK
jgi:hypothetical protein